MKSIAAPLLLGAKGPTMHITHVILMRSIFQLLAAVLVVNVSFGLSLARAQPATSVERPDPTTLQHGDLVWPKNPKAIVLYDSSLEGTREAMKKQWESERDAFVKKVRSNPNATPQLRQIATNLEALSYEEFSLQYLAGHQKSDIEQLGAFDDVFSVGHIAIIEVAPNGERFVIEAVWGNTKKVQRVPYTVWIKDRTGSWVWVGRVRGLADGDKAKFVEQAKTYIGRPYDFWNFDLGDDSSFYCSKLVWLSLVKSVNVYLDGDRSFQRAFWFSPKQTWNSPSIIRINAPREYSY